MMLDPKETRPDRRDLAPSELAQAVGGVHAPTRAGELSEELGEEAAPLEEEPVAVPGYRTVLRCRTKPVFRSRAGGLDT
jgi:hypothetical protein